MELRSDPVSGVDGPGVVVSSGLEAAAKVSHVSLSPPSTTNTTNTASLTCRPALDALPAKLGAFPTGHIVVALDLQPGALVASMTLPASLQRTRDRGVSSALAATEMVSQHITTTPEMSAEEFPTVSEGTYLRLKVLEQNLQLYGRSPESVIRDIRSYPSRYENGGSSRAICERGRERTLLLVPQQMGFALELLATLIAGR